MYYLSILCIYFYILNYVHTCTVNTVRCSKCTCNALTLTAFIPVTFFLHVVNLMDIPVTNYAYENCPFLALCYNHALLYTVHLYVSCITIELFKETFSLKKHSESLKKK